MKISASQVRAARLYRQQGRTRLIEEKSSVSNPAHKVSLSQEGREIQAVKQRIAASPDIRADKVNELRRAIKTGTYKVSGKEVAEEMFNRAAADVMLND